MKKNNVPYQRNEALFTCGLIVVAYFLGIYTYIVAGHSCADKTMGMQHSKICKYKAQADAHLGNFPEYTAWLENNFHVGLNHIEQELHG